jgi:hypothetical protein
MVKNSQFLIPPDTQLYCSTTIQIIRKGDKIPFDVSHGRTIVIDTSDVYTLIDRINSAKYELTEYARSISGNLTSEVSDDNPIKVYLPGIKITFVFYLD